MKRPSNLIIAFALAIFAAFGTYALSRMLFRIFPALSPAPSIEMQEEQ